MEAPDSPQMGSQSDGFRATLTVRLERRRFAARIINIPSQVPGKLYTRGPVELPNLLSGPPSVITMASI
ncbi:hypothetical protein WJX73_003987 [Symbiochloris irregularis]|uniref:Uncharacterized protein n=1 Tax=Symbiochloris irregularis TaxID=706552 RepID=A0AAW1PLX0_9CHLO